MAFSRPVARALRASVAREGAEAAFSSAAGSLRPDQFDELATGAVYHGIAGYVWSAARACGGLPPQTANLKTAVQFAMGCHLRTLADLEHLAQVLEGASVPWLVFKGPVLAETVHARPEFRAYSDLDVLVPPARLGVALEALEAGGCRTLDRNWTLIGQETKGEVHVRLPLGTVADLHWSLLNDRVLRGQYSVRTAGVFERSRVVPIGQIPVRTLDEIDTVVHLALHTMLSGGHRLIWLKDVERALEQLHATPAEITVRARSWGAELALAAVVGRTRVAIGCPPLARSLSPAGLPARAWLGLNAAVCRLVPAEREDGGGSLGRMVARSIRPSVRASTRSLAAKAWLFLLGGGRDAATRRRPDPTSPGSDRFDAGGVRARMAYLETVARQEQ